MVAELQDQVTKLERLQKDLVLQAHENEEKLAHRDITPRKAGNMKKKEQRGFLGSITGGLEEGLLATSFLDASVSAKINPTSYARCVAGCVDLVLGGVG